MRRLALATGIGLLSLYAALSSGCSPNDNHEIVQPIPMLQSYEIERLQRLERPALVQDLAWPVVGPVSSYFGLTHPRGIDIDSYWAPRQPVFAAHDGRISFMGGNPEVNLGYYVVIVHENGMETVYGHLDSFVEGLFTGDKVRKCDQIGYVGTTGYSTGAHLHFEVITEEGRIDPLTVLSDEHCQSDYRPPEEEDTYRALNLLLNSDLEEAEIMLRSIIENNPHDRENFEYSLENLASSYLLGEVLICQGSIEEAKDVLQEADKINLEYSDIGSGTVRAMTYEQHEIFRRLRDSDDSNGPSYEEIIKVFEHCAIPK